jgi:hypothetical protein
MRVTLCCWIAQETDGVNDLFAPYGWKDYLYKAWTPLCQAKFGVTPDPSYIEKYLVGTGVDSYSRIIFTSGSYDPVRGFSPVTDISPDLLAFQFVGGTVPISLSLVGLYIRDADLCVCVCVVLCTT